MTRIRTPDGVGLHLETAGQGMPILFIHEFAGNAATWEPQLRFFARSHRCVAYSARGYPPSDIPAEPESYSQDIAVADAVAVLDALGIERAHIVGHSMGAYTALHVGLRHPGRCFSVAALGCGWGSNPAERDASVKLCEDIAEMFMTRPIGESAAAYGDAPMRRTFRAKDPRGFAEFVRILAGNAPQGLALTMLNLQLKRPTLWEMEADLKAMAVPLLVGVGDEDFPCLDGSLFLKRTVPTAGLLVLPRAGHTITTEEPDAVNRALGELFAAAEAGTWMAHRGDDG